MYEPAWRHPSTPEEAARALADTELEARVIAGGTDLTVLIRNGSARPDVLVDLGGIDELRFVRELEGVTEIGALSTHAAVAGDSHTLSRAPVLSAACRSVGSPQIRARGTLGGNLGNASPAADAAAALLALGASVVVESPGGSGDRSPVPLESFFRGPGATALAPGEFVRAIRFPTPSAKSKSAYYKIGQRNALAIAIVSVAVLFDPDAGTVNIALGSVAPTPVRATDAETLFAREWQSAGDREALLAAVAEKATGAASCIDDVRASAHYRTLLVEAVTRRALQEVCR